VSANLTTAAKWAIAVPFFALPISLTIDAPDVHGGYGIHLRQAIGLATLGAVAALAVAAWARLEANPRAHRAMRLALLVPVLAVLGHLLVVAGGALGDALVAAMGSMPSDAAGAQPTGGLARLLGRGASGAEPYGLKPWARALVAVAVLGVGLATDSRHRLRNAAIAAAAGIAGIAASRVLALTATSSLGIAADLPAVITAGVAAVAFGFLRDARPHHPARPLSLLLGSPTALGERLLVVVVAAGFGGVTALGLDRAAEALSAAVGTRGPEGALSAFTVALWIAVCVLAALRLGRRECDRDAEDEAGRAADEAGRAVALGGWCLAAAVVIVGRSFGDPVVEVVLLGFLLILTGFSLRPGTVALGGILGIPAFRYLTECTGHFVPPPLASPVLDDQLAMFLGVAFGGTIAALATRRPTSPTTPARLAGTLVLLLIAPILALHLAIAWGLAPVPTAVAAALALGLAAHPRIPVRWPTWALYYVCFALLTQFKLGPSPADCADLDADLLLARESDAEPYDVIPDPTTGGVLVSFKRIDRRGGYLEVFDAADPTKRSRFETRRSAGDGPLWPERLERDPRTGNVWAQLLGIGAYAMWELSLQPGPEVVVVRRLPIPWEPGNPVVDDVRNRLVMSYVPNREPTNPLAQAFDLDTLRPAAATPKPAPVLEMADFIAFDRSADRFYVPAFYGAARFALYELDDRLQVVRARESFHPSIGVAAEAGTVWLTNPLAGTIDVLRDLEVVHTVDAGTFPRDLLVDPVRRRLHVGAYSSGEVHSYDIAEDGSLAHAGATRVGSLLRGIGLDPRTGDVYAASGCGVFRVPYSGSIVH